MAVNMILLNLIRNTQRIWLTLSQLYKNNQPPRQQPLWWGYQSWPNTRSKGYLSGVIDTGQGILVCLEIVKYNK